MPFYSAMPDGGGGGPSAAGPVTMRVAPDQVLRLKARLEAVRENVETFIRREGDNLRARPLAQDEVSIEAARIFAENADTAIDVTQKFVDELNRSIQQLGEIAKTYNLVEDANTTAMQQQNRGI